MSNPKKPNQTNSILVGNLSVETNEASLKELFSEAGLVKSITIPANEKTGYGRGYAVVEMSTAIEAERAIELLNGQDIGGRQLAIHKVQAQEPHKKHWYSWGNENEV